MKKTLLSVLLDDGYFFASFPSRSSKKRRIQMIDNKQRPIDDPRRPSSVQNRPLQGVFSVTQPHKGNRIERAIGIEPTSEAWDACSVGCQHEG
jgi:hypothetical protein